MNGVQSQAGYAAATSWTQVHINSSPVALTQKMRLVSESISESYDKLRSAALVGTAAEHEFVNGVCVISGEVVVELSYNDDEILEYCMGSVAGGVYTLTSPLSKVFHMTIDKGGVLRYYYAGCKVNSFTISGDGGGESPVTLSMNITVREVSTGSALFPALTAPNQPVMFRDLSYAYIGDQANALGAGDMIPVKSFEISCDHALQTDAKDSTSAVYVLEPLNNGFRVVSIKLGLARYNTANNPTGSISLWRSAGTRLQAQLSLVSGGDSFTINIPEAKITSGGDWNVGGPGMISSDVTLGCYRNIHNTPMAAVVDQFSITAV